MPEAPHASILEEAGPSLLCLGFEGGVEAQGLGFRVYGVYGAGCRRGSKASSGAKSSPGPILKGHLTPFSHPTPSKAKPPSPIPFRFRPETQLKCLLQKNFFCCRYCARPVQGGPRDKGCQVPLGFQAGPRQVSGRPWGVGSGSRRTVCPGQLTSRLTWARAIDLGQEVVVSPGIQREGLCGFRFVSWGPCLCLGASYHIGLSLSEANINRRGEGFFAERV